MTYRTYKAIIKDGMSETAVQVEFFAMLRREKPITWGRLALHIRNEGKKTPQQVVREKLEGMQTGASDIVIPARIPFVCELKRCTRPAKFTDEQQAYLTAAHEAGSFACVCYGLNALLTAYSDWLSFVGDA